MFITIKCVRLFKISSIYFIKASWQLIAKSLQSRSCIWAVWKQGGVPTRRLFWNVVSPRAVVCLRTQWPGAGGRQPSGGNTGDHPPPLLFFLFLNHTHAGFWESGLKPSFPALWVKVKHNHLKGDSEQEESAEMDSEALSCEPCSAPNFSSCQSHTGSLHAYPEHCLLKDEPGSQSFRGFSKLTRFSLGKQEMEGCPWLLRYFLENFFNVFN